MNTIELAREVGMEWQGGFTRVVECVTQAELTRFAALVRAQALEEAAEVCDNSASHCHDDGLLQLVLKSNAAAIRALKGEQE